MAATAAAGNDGTGDQGVNEDYDNLILVGVWLAVKENGEALQKLLKWSDLPTDA